MSLLSANLIVDSWIQRIVSEGLTVLDATKLTRQTQNNIYTFQGENTEYDRIECTLFPC